MFLGDDVNVFTIEVTKNQVGIQKVNFLLCRNDIGVLPLIPGWGFGAPGSR